MILPPAGHSDTCVNIGFKNTPLNKFQVFSKKQQQQQQQQNNDFASFQIKFPPLQICQIWKKKTNKQKTPFLENPCFSDP